MNDNYMQGKRQSGRTSKQLKYALPNAAFICPNYHHKRYVQTLARKINRTDLKIYTMYEIFDLIYGLRFSEIIIDHSINLVKQYNQSTVDKIIPYITKNNIPKFIRKLWCEAQANKNA